MRHIVRLSSKEISKAARIHVLNEAVFISHTLGKGAYLTIFLSAMGKSKGRLGSLTLVW